MDTTVAANIYEYVSDFWPRNQRLILNCENNFAFVAVSQKALK